MGLLPKTEREEGSSPGTRPGERRFNSCYRDQRRRTTPNQRCANCTGDARDSRREEFPDYCTPHDLPRPNIQSGSVCVPLLCSPSGGARYRNIRSHKVSRGGRCGESYKNKTVCCEYTARGTRDRVLGKVEPGAERKSTHWQTGR